MAKARRTRSRLGVPRWLVRAVPFLMPVVAAALVAAPQAVTDRARVWAAPVVRPFRHVTAGWVLDLASPGGPAGGGAAGRSGLAPADLAARLETMENALAEATARLADYDRRLREVARLREALRDLPCRIVPARLVAPEVGGGLASALVSKGRTAGVAPGGVVVRARLDRGAREALAGGEPVLTAAGLVGVVEAVGPATSSVRLVTDPRTSLMVQLVLWRDGVWRPGPAGVARGAGDGRTLLVEGVPRTADVRAGDFVVTSPSPEARLPAYLVVGRVVEARLKAADLFYTLVVEPRAPAEPAADVYVLSRDLAGPSR